MIRKPPTIWNTRNIGWADHRCPLHVRRLKFFGTQRSTGVLMSVVCGFYWNAVCIKLKFVFTVMHFPYVSIDCFCFCLFSSPSRFFSFNISQALSWVVSFLCRIWKLAKEVFCRWHWKELTWNLCTVRYGGNL